MRDFTKKYSGRDLAMFLVPIILSELIQEFYSLINMAVVSRYLTYQAVAAMGACNAFTKVQDHVFVSMTAGFGVYIARCIGTKNKEEFQKGFSGAVYFTAALSLVSVLACFFSRQLLGLANVSAELMEDANKYLITLLLGCFFIGIKNLLTNTIQGFGETRFISVLSFVSVVTHTILVVFLIIVLKIGVAASGWAILINNAWYSLVLFLYLKKTQKELLVFTPMRRLTSEVIKTLGINGISKSGMTILVAVGTFFVQAALNTLSTETIAAFSYVNGTLNSFFMQPLAACGAAASAIAAQNAGAKNMKVLREYIKKLAIINAIIGIFSTGICFTCGSQMITLLAGSEVSASVIEAGKTWFSICAPSYTGLAWFFIFRNVLQVLEDYKKPVILGSMEMIIKMMMSVFFVGRMGFAAVCAAISLSWASTGITSFVFYLRTAKRVEKKWNQS